MLRNAQAGNLTVFALHLAPKGVRRFPPHLHAEAVSSLHVVYSDVLRDAVFLVGRERDAGLRLQLQLRTLCCVSVMLSGYGYCMCFLPLMPQPAMSGQRWAVVCCWIRES
jgi:hypothetical protein